MHSPDIYSENNCNRFLSVMTQQARNAFNYWNAKTESPILQEIVIAFISPYKHKFLFFDCPASFFPFLSREKERGEKAPCNLFGLLI